MNVIDTEGPAAVSMRAVARELGVDAKSLYNHVDGKDGLLDAVAEYVLGALELPELTGDLRADLTAIAHAFREPATTHPEAASLVLTRQLASLEGLAPVEAVLEVLAAAGCPPEDAVHLLRTVVAMLIGTILREVNAGPTYGTADLDAIARREAALTQSGFPAIAAAAPYLARFDSNAEFDFAVRRGVSAIVAYIEEVPPASGGGNDPDYRFGIAPKS